MLISNGSPATPLVYSPCSSHETLRCWQTASHADKDVGQQRQTSDTKRDQTVRRELFKPSTS